MTNDSTARPAHRKAKWGTDNALARISRNNGRLTTAPGHFYNHIEIPMGNNWIIVEQVWGTTFCVINAIRCDEKSFLKAGDSDRTVPERKINIFRLLVFVGSFTEKWKWDFG